MLALAGVLPSTAGAQEAPAAESTGAEGGNGFVRHQAGPFWVWFGPQSWNGSGSANGLTRRGFFEFDYDFNTFVDPINYCFARNLGLYSLANTWNIRRPILIQINQRLAYSGPGACDPSPSTPC